MTPILRPEGLYPQIIRYWGTDWEVPSAKGRMPSRREGPSGLPPGATWANPRR